MVEGENQLWSPYVPWHVCSHTQYTHMPTHAIALSHTCYVSVYTQYQQTHACTHVPFLDYTHHDHVHLVVWPRDVRVASWETAVP